MSQGADSLLGNDGGETPLQMAVFVGDPDLVALFFGTMGAEASVPLRDRRGNTPLHYAASFNKLDLLAILVQHGGDIYVRNNDGCTVFLQSVVAGQKDVAAAILKCSPASLGDTDARGGNALHLICKNGAEGAAPMALWLLSVGVSVHARDEHNCLPLHYAAAAGSVAATRTLLWKMLEPLAFAAPGGSGHAAAADPGAGVMAFASVCGLSPDMDVAGLAGRAAGSLLGSPLFFAAHHRRQDVVALLLRGVPRPCDVAPLHELAVPQAGWVCDASGAGIASTQGACVSCQASNRA